MICSVYMKFEVFRAQKSYEFHLCGILPVIWEIMSPRMWCWSLANRSDISK